MYFNFELAKEMGLISPRHPHEMTKELKQKLIETFSIRIINEYDIANKTHFPEENIKPNQYMATRYLQLQHPDKKGRTSGDGRSIWNGQVEHNGKVWDVSSRGTGVTKLSPGFVEAGKPLKTGQSKFGYGCGLADIDELYGSALMSEVFYKNRINTERTLAIIELQKGIGIGVRAGQNLLRPAHLFSYMKQYDHKNLKQTYDYFIARQIQNKKFKPPSSTKDPKIYLEYTKKICREYAQFAALLDSNYVFTWLDWDGDNFLTDAGIIDYGSIRQFGMRHDEYRYDDIDRFSTTLTEQRQKTRQVVQVFIQISEFLTTKKKSQFKDFNNHPLLKIFDQEFENSLRKEFLKKVGLSTSEIERVIRWSKKRVDSALASFQKIEKLKVSRKSFQVTDGIHRPALYNTRKLLQKLPQVVLSEPRNIPKALHQIAVGKETSLRDKRLQKKNEILFTTFYQNYVEVFKSLYPDSKERAEKLKVAQTRSEKINFQMRMTGNSVSVIVDKILSSLKNRKIEPHQIQTVIDQFVLAQSQSLPLIPKKTQDTEVKKILPTLKSLQKVLIDLSEDI